MSTSEERYADDAGRYRLESRIATGGMGEVWRGFDTVLGRQVAVKLLKAEYADDATFRARFETEARHAASLHHPGIAAVYDFGESQDPGPHARPWLVMELVEGQPLSALLRPGAPMDPDAMRGLLSQVGDALGAAHRAGIVHRDVKPANLLVTPDRQIKVTDFGIARAAEGMALTHTGQVMGTPQYLSPEQAEGGRATPASDVYSLGVVAYECLVGRRPFEADTPVATALAHLRQPVPELPERIPADLASVVSRALAKDPADRFADGTAFAAALRDPATHAVPLPPREDVTTVLPATTSGPVAPTPASGTPAPHTTVLPAAGAAAGPATAATPVEPGGDRSGNGLLWAVAALLLVVVLGAGWLWWETGREPAEEPTPRTTTSPDPRPSRSEEPAEVEIDEDDYVGRDVRDVARELSRLGLRVVRDEQANPGDETANEVTAVDPTGSLRKGERVTVSFWGAPPEPEPEPSPTPTPEPSPTPTPTPSPTPTAEPTPTPTPTPTATPEATPTTGTSASPAADPTVPAGSTGAAEPTGSPGSPDSPGQVARSTG